GVILLIDYFAIRAAENEFLIRFAEEWGADRNLDLLPNWAFSLAFAQFNLADSGSNEKADESLQDAL
uniref:Uncharacterized protein n=1 Tax=Ciona savignyi TaxID=51511 RepID=H2YLA4_CIOSA